MVVLSRLAIGEVRSPVGAGGGEGPFLVPDVGVYHVEGLRQRLYEHHRPALVHQRPRDHLSTVFGRGSEITLVDPNPHW